MKAYVWKQSRKAKTHTLQVNARKSLRTKNKVYKAAGEGEWELIGETMSGKKITFLFSRSFENDVELKEWAKSFPCDVYKIERNGTGNERRLS